MNYAVQQFSFERPTLWNLIVGHRYITVSSTGMSYVEVLEQLKTDMGEDWQKPVVLVSCAQNSMGDQVSITDLEICDYEY